MKKRIKLFLIFAAITIITGTLLGVFFIFSLNILYADMDRAINHGMIAGIVSAILIAIYAYVSGIVKKLLLKYFDIKDLDDL